MLAALTRVPGHPRTIAQNEARRAMGRASGKVQLNTRGIGAAWGNAIFGGPMPRRFNLKPWGLVPVGAKNRSPTCREKPGFLGIEPLATGAAPLHEAHDAGCR